MYRIPRLLLPALALFVMGMVADRILWHHIDGGPDSGNGEEGIPARMAADSLTSGSLRNRARSGAGAGSDERQANQPRNNSRQDNESPVPHSIREALEALERGGHMDAETANRILSQAPTGQARREVLHRLANLWARMDPEAAAAWAGGLEGSDGRHALESVIHRWADDDPAAAANYMTQLPASEQNLHLVHALAIKWAERDQAAAMQWASAQTNPAKRERAMGGVVSAWSATEPAAAAEFAASIESQFERNRVLEVAARRWASQDTAKAMEWAKGLPDADRQQATRAILREVAERDPSRAGAIFQELTAALPAEAQATRDYRHMAHEIASIWSSSSPREAAVWATQFPEGEVQRGAVASVADHWLQIDPVAAGEWILRLPEGPTRDAGAERVVHSTIQSDPERAFQWASSIGDEGHRTGQMREVLNQWKTSDPVSAQAALGAASVSPEQRHELSRLFGRVAPPSQAEPAAAQQ